ncbi:MAG: hypothetical protein FWE25_04930 [Lachnospiraceae bacterium]|nr:hypothetical protein [Lachnospiraceae bacterium]
MNKKHYVQNKKKFRRKQIIGLLIVFIMTIGSLHVIADSSAVPLVQNIGFSSAYAGAENRLGIRSQAERMGDTLENAENVWLTDSNEERFDLATEEHVTDDYAEEVEIDTTFDTTDVAEVVETAALGLRFNRFGAAQVFDSASFVAALNDIEVAVIEVTASFIMANFTAAASPTIRRSLFIYSESGYSITFGNATTQINLGAVAGGAELHLDNIHFHRTAGDVSYVFVAPDDNTDWNVVLHDYVLTGSRVLNPAAAPRVTTQTQGWDVPMVWRGGAGNTNVTEPNRGGLLRAPGGRLTVVGQGNHLAMRAISGGSSAQNSHIWVRDFEMLPNAQLRVYSSGDTAAAAIRIDNHGTVNMRERADLHIWNLGGRMGSDGDHSPQFSHGLYGRIAQTMIEANVRIHLETNNVSYRSTISHDFTMGGGAVINSISNDWQGFVLAHGYSDGDIGAVSHRVDISGANTQINVFTNNSSTANNGSGVFISGSNSIIVVRDKAQVNTYSLRTGAISFMGRGIVFHVDDDARIMAFSRGSGNRLAAALRFRLSGDMTMNIDGGYVTAIAASGSTSTRAAAVRFYGGNNELNVNGGGTLRARSYADNDAIQFSSGNSNFNIADRFILVDNMSMVDAWASSSIALNGDSGTSITRIVAGEDTIFKLQGSNSGTGGIINGGRIRFQMTRPLFFDFRNVGNGNIFNTSHTSGNYSQWIGMDTDFAVWPRGDAASFNRDPTEAWSRISFNVTGTNLNSSIGAGNVIDPVNVSHTQNSTSDNLFRLRWNSMTPNMGRMSANNARPEVDWLRIPTNADMRIFGHVSVREGRDEIRSAWANEVWVVLVVTDLDGNEWRTEATTETRSMFGGLARAGLFEAYYTPNDDNVPEFIPEGYTVHVETARRWSGGRTETNLDRYHEALPSMIRSGRVRSRDVTPPSPVVLPPQLATLDVFTTELYGTAEPGALIRVAIDDNWLLEGSSPRVVVVDADGNWTFPLPRLYDGMRVKIYASDNKGMGNEIDNLFPAHNLLDIVRSLVNDGANGGIPLTAGAVPLYGENIRGNVNPSEAMSFHDAYFARATLRLVVWPSDAGTLEFLSTPDIIDFGTLGIAAGFHRIAYEYMSAPVIVGDTRATRSPWQLIAVLDDHLYNASMGHTLYHALVRRQDGSSTILIPGDSIVFHSHLVSSGELLEIVNITQDWGIVNGLMIELEGAAVRVGSYSAEIEWFLGDTVVD